MVLRATCLFFGRHYLNFGQHDSGFRRHDFGRDDSRATWSISFRAFHLTFPVDEVIWYLKVTLNSHSKGHLSLLLVTWSRRCVMSMTYYLHMISEQFWKKVACGVDEWVMRYIIKTGEEQGQFPSRSPEWLTTNNRIFVGHAVHTVIWDRFNATFNVNVKTDVLFR